MLAIHADNDHSDTTRQAAEYRVAVFSRCIDVDQLTETLVATPGLNRIDAKFTRLTYWEFFLSGSLKSKHNSMQREDWQKAHDDRCGLTLISDRQVSEAHERRGLLREPKT